MVFLKKKKVDFAGLTGEITRGQKSPKAFRQSNWRNAKKKKLRLISPVALAK